MTTSPAYQVVNPSTGAASPAFDFAGDDDIRAAVASSAAAYQSWRALPLPRRCEILREVGRLFAERAADLGAVATEEMGKAPSAAREEAAGCRDIFDYYANHAEELLAAVNLPGRDGMWIESLPMGTILGVMPWNYPFYQVARFVAPNLVAGNTVIVKHSENCPGSALAIADIMAQAGVPDGVYLNVFATHRQVESMIADPRVCGVSLTGSERAGSAVAAAAGRHLKKVVLELGGSDPYIVLDTDDVGLSAAAAWATRMENVGQACNSNKRMIVVADIFDEFVAALVDRATVMRPRLPGADGPGLYSPMVTRAAAMALHQQVQDAVDEGATLHVGGELSATGAYFAPAVLTGVTQHMRAFHEELFGPVAVVYRVADDEEAVSLANAVGYGLGGSVWSRDERRALQVAARLEVGMTNVNAPEADGPDIPFGGIKRSGFGRELGAAGLAEFLNRRLVYLSR